MRVTHLLKSGPHEKPQTVYGQAGLREVVQEAIGTYNTMMTIIISSINNINTISISIGISNMISIILNTTTINKLFASKISFI